jgi:hypothetical protein
MQLRLAGAATVVFLTIFIELKGKRRVETALFSPAPEILSREKKAVVHSVSKGCEEFVRQVSSLWLRSRTAGSN